MGDALRVAACLLLAVTAGCLDSAVVTCADGTVCPAGTACDTVRGGCVHPDRLTGCEAMADGAACSYPGQASGVCFEELCVPAGCGNQVMETGEVCDDGNRAGGDGCAADCASDESCGNQTTDVLVGEQCDDGNSLEHDGCTSGWVVGLPSGSRRPARRGLSVWLRRRRRRPGRL